MLSGVQQKSIRFGGAALTATATGYLLYSNQKEKDYKGVSIISLVAGVLAYFIIDAILKIIDEALAKPDPVDVPLDAQSSGSSTSAYDPRPLTDALYQDIYEIFGIRNLQPYQDLAALSNTNFVQVYNDWTDRYWQKDKETLRVAIDGENLAFSSVLGSGIMDTLNNRFDSLNLN